MPAHASCGRSDCRASDALVPTAERGISLLAIDPAVRKGCRRTLFISGTCARPTGDIPALRPRWNFVAEGDLSRDRPLRPRDLSGAYRANGLLWPHVCRAAFIDGAPLPASG